MNGVVAGSPINTSSLYSRSYLRLFARKLEKSATYQPVVKVKIAANHPSGAKAR